MKHLDFWLFLIFSRSHHVVVETLLPADLFQNFCFRDLKVSDPPRGLGDMSEKFSPKNSNVEAALQAAFCLTRS